MTSVALIAVAKDEDTYIHEWIHHHLYLGFSPIYIGVNRTSDKTIEIIEKISKTEKEVHVYCLDWIDQGSNGLNKDIQKIGYAYLSTKIDKSKIDYVGFLDIDEFWFNVENKNIHDFIDENMRFDIASFYWLCQLGEDREFLPPFKDVLYDADKHVKSIVSTSTLDHIQTFTPHVPIYKANYYKNLVHIDQQGKKIFQLGSKKRFNKPFPVSDLKTISTCILHRMKRSEREYLSIVLRGRPSGHLIKSNGRTGFKKANSILPSIYDENYYNSLIKFILTNDLTEILKLARNKKLHYYQDKIESMNDTQLIAEFYNAQIALANTIGLNVYASALIKKVEDVDSLKEFSESLESYDLKLSIQLMQKAHDLSPKDPLIKNKLDEYLQ